jgi:hypothetical protein
MAAKAKTPIGKIVIAALIALLSIFIIWLIVDNPFASKPTEDNVIYFDNKPDINSDKAKTYGPKEGDSQFTTFNPQADSSQFDGQYQYTDGSDDNEEREVDENVNEETNYNEVNNTVVVRDQDPPLEPLIVSAPKRETFNNAPTFVYQGEEGASFRCSLNKKGYQNSVPCPAVKTYINLKHGKRYVFRVWQVDKLGQRSYQPAVKKFYIKNPSPPKKPTMISGPKTYTNESYYQFKFKGVTNKFKCSLNQSLFKKAVDCVSPAATYDLPDGRYVFRVWQIRGGIKSKSPTQYIFNVDRTAPSSPTITSSPSLETSSTTQTFQFAGEGGAKFSCAIDSDALASCTSPYVTSLGPGSYTFKVYQTDRAGNRSLEPAEASFTVLEPAPLSTMSTPKRGLRAYESDPAPVSGVYTAQNQTTDEETTFTVNVLAAIELSDPSDDSDSVAPVAGGASNSIADLDLTADLRSNLSWQINSSVAGELTGGSTGSRDLLNSLTGQGSAVDSGSRNLNNTAQAVDADYDQSVSWGDEAGAYTETITHTATQTLSP